MLSLSRGLRALAVTTPVKSASTPTTSAPPARHKSGVWRLLKRRQWVDPKKMDKLWRARAPYVHGFTDNSNFEVPGVSDKQHPIMLDWRRPERVSRVRPGEHGSGDLSGLPELDPQDPVLRMEGLPEFQAASEQLRKVKSLGYSRQRDKMERMQRDFRRLIQRHKLDEESLEVRIARKTLHIRYAQEMLSTLEDFDRTNPAVRHVLKQWVDQRRNYLRRLRETDFKKFEWLLEKLDLVYKPRPFTYERIERKKQIMRLTDLWCEELKQHRLNELQDELKREQPIHLREKAETLRWAKKEQEELGLEVTVREEEIAECLARAEAVEKELAEAKAKDVKREEGYYVYVPESKDTSQKYI